MDLEKKDVKIVEGTKAEEAKAKPLTIEVREGFEAFFLPILLGARRNVLEAELDRVVAEITELRLKNGLTELFKKFGLDGTFTVSWDFYPESDDSGGTYLSISDLDVTALDDPEFDAHELTVEMKFSNGVPYEAELMDKLYDLFSEISYDIEKSSLYKFTVIVPKGE